MQGRRHCQPREADTIASEQAVAQQVGGIDRAGGGLDPCRSCHADGLAAAVVRALAGGQEQGRCKAEGGQSEALAERDRQAWHRRAR